MSEVLRGTKPNFFDLWLRYRFDLIKLSDNAGVLFPVIEQMMNSLPVAKDDALKVLFALSVMLDKPLNLESMDVVLRDEGGSEIALLKEQIDREYAAAQQGLQGLAQGAAQHAFIIERTERVAALFLEMKTRYGDDVVREVMTTANPKDGPANATQQ